RTIQRQPCVRALLLLQLQELLIQCLGMFPQLLDERLHQALDQRRSVHGQRPNPERSWRRPLPSAARSSAAFSICRLDTAVCVITVLMLFIAWWICSMPAACWLADAAIWEAPRAESPMMSVRRFTVSPVWAQTASTRFTLRLPSSATITE